ncbi:hypothetical protein AVEN_93058-1 [Araneus ventricosus]|uniref:Uncharacterized protein n=1 Tax=Araneus ventricosus TaxID=182803 RepID=A0A4Y2PZS2_ARAVE|nr:hypothetical protein AVEN_93058-1 [Araneus ventricosus]
MSHLDFRLELVEELAKIYEESKHSSQKTTYSDRLTGRHFPSHIEPTQKMKASTKIYIVCSQKFIEKGQRQMATPNTRQTESATNIYPNAVSDNNNPLEMLLALRDLREIFQAYSETFQILLNLKNGNTVQEKANILMAGLANTCPEKNSAVVFSSAAGCDQIFLRKESGFFIVQLGATRFSCEESRDFFIDMKVVLCKFPALDGDKSPPAVLQAAQSASGSQPVKQAVPVVFSWSIVSLLPLEFSKITMFCCGCRWR